MSRRSAVLALGAVVALSALTWTFPVSASTLQDSDDAWMSADIFGPCVPEELLEVAFANLGKATRAPQTCLPPDPCSDGFDRSLASGLIGRDPGVGAYSRMAELFLAECGGPLAPDAFTREALLAAVLNGHEVPLEVKVGHSPLPGAALALASALGSLMIFRRRDRG
jgi:hypothetical protein